MFVYELFEEDDDKSLRDNHPVATKKKRSKTVPNGVPTNESESDLEKQTKTKGIKQ